MNALAAPPPFPTNPTTGEVYCGFVWNGSSWVCQSGGPLLIIQAFTASGTYFPSPGLSFALGEVQGGGGGGGGALGYATASVPGWIMGGGGGGSGMYVRKAVSAALVRGGIPIAIGAG